MSNIFDKAKDAIRSDQGEQASDKAIDALGIAVDKATGGKYTGKIDEAKRVADEKIGNEGRAE